MDYRSIAQFAIKNPDTWEMLSVGYPPETMAEVREEIDRIKGFTSQVTNLVDTFLDLYPMTEREYKSTKRAESRLVTEYNGYQVELRVWTRLGSIEESTEEDEE